MADRRPLILAAWLGAAALLLAPGLGAGGRTEAAEPAVHLSVATPTGHGATVAAGRASVATRAFVTHAMRRHART